MADITASGDITVTVENKAIEGKRKRNRCKVLLSTGGNDYPAGGIPMAPFGKLGMVRFLDYMSFFDQNDADGTHWKYDKENNKLRGYRVGATGAELAEITAGTATTTRTWYAEAVGW